MSNTIYIDSNKANCINQEGDENQWTYKLNTELLLPKGSEISVQNAFINKKGITGGSIEIEEDIVETVSYTFYITDTPQFKPVNEYVKPLRPFFRSTIHCAGGTYRGMFSNDPDTTGADVIKSQANRVVYGTNPLVNLNAAATSGARPSASFDKIKFPPLGDTGSVSGAEATYSATFKNPDFAENGGSGMICPMMNVQTNGSATGGQIFEPVIKKIDIRVPKGVYGIGELGQLIEDQFNGVKVYDAATNTFKNDTMLRREEDLAADDDYFDGQPYNRPFMTKTKLVDRSFRSDIDTVGLVDDFGNATEQQVFMNMRDYRTMVEFLRDTASTPSTSDELDLFAVKWAQGIVADDGSRDPDNHPNRYIKPFFMLRYELDVGGGSRGNTVDSDEAFGYDLHGVLGIGVNKKESLVGTTNFSFKYDTEKNGFSINGLHNVFKNPSHDRFANANSTAGQDVVYYKKATYGVFGEDNYGASIGSTSTTGWSNFRRRRAVLNRPETRDMGIMIINWARTTAESSGDTNRVKTTDVGRFQDFFETKKEAKKSWEKTLWHRLGFDYEQLNDQNNYGVSKNYEATTGNIINYGFTTDVDVDNSVIKSISTLTNPLNATYTPSGGTAIQVGGFQMFQNTPMAHTLDWINNGTLPAASGSYGGNRYTGALAIPVVISDVGGIVASRLPTLSSFAYYLLTSDVLDNYKDNVKRGDILPLLSVIPKSSLSNEDFIASQSDIVQVLSQDKVVNKITIAVYNPDMTIPTLDPNSSVVLKITLPNKTPSSLLPPPEQKAVAQSQASLVGV